MGNDTFSVHDFNRVEDCWGALMLYRIIAALGRKPYIYKIWHTRRLLVFMADKNSSRKLSWTMPFELNSLSSFALFEPYERWQDGKLLLSQAETRVRAGGIVSTLVKDEKLVAWSFAVPSTKSYLPWVEQKVTYPPQSASLLSGYVAPSARGQGIHRQQQNFRIHHMLLKFEYVFGFVQSNNVAAVKAAKSSTMRHVATIETKWRLFVPIKKTIIFDIDLGMEFESPIYTPDGTLHDACEIHDGVRVLMQR